MKLGDYITLAVITVVVVLAITFIIRQKRKGVKCIGCPHSKNCNKCSQSCTLENK